MRSDRMKYLKQFKEICYSFKDLKTMKKWQGHILYEVAKELSAVTASLTYKTQNIKKQYNGNIPDPFIFTLQLLAP